MVNIFSIRKCLFTVLLIVVIQECSSLFLCKNKQDQKLPDLPSAYSTNIRINFPKKHYTVEARKVADSDGKREAIEFWQAKRHVKYIRQDKQVLFIKYNDEEVPTCTVKSASSIEFEEEDTGPNKIFDTTAKILQQKSKMAIVESSLEHGLAMKKWEGCFKDPFINISVGFTEPIWTNAHTSALFENQFYITLIEAETSNEFMTAEFYNFNPRMPDIEEFQPPENVYCEGFQSDKKPPPIPDYFSYDAEYIVYESSEGIAPIVSHRSVYYDYPSRIVRIDFYDPLATDQEEFAKVKAQDISIIHDFTSGMQYDIDPLTGKCKVDNFKTTVKVVDIKETVNSEMPKGVDFFSLSAEKISYNGRYKTRGVSVDVFNARIVSNDKTNTKYIYTWYFSTDRTQIVEKDKVERNVLLRIVTRPETGIGKERRVDVNFYNFEKDEPLASIFDLTSCYNESFSKKYVITFPANDDLRGSEKFLKLPIHLALKSATGVAKQRIFISEVSFSDKYMFAEFIILERPSVFEKKTTDKNISLDDAVSKLQKAISEDKFSVTLLSDNGKFVTLKPEPNGLNEFAGDRKEVPKTASYNEGSVIGLTIGMLILGVLLGAVTLNLIMSRKYGVSLFQKSNHQNDGFNNPLNESSI